MQSKQTISLCSPGKINLINTTRQGSLGHVGPRKYHRILSVARLTGIHLNRKGAPCILKQRRKYSSKLTDQSRMAPGSNEPIVSGNSPMPHGYCFVPKGNIYVTRNCRKLTHEAQRILYLVDGQGNQHLGIRCPIHIFTSVTAMEEATRSQRAVNVQRRDDAVASEFRRTITEIFPRIPSAETSKIVERAVKKHSGRVGRAGNLDIRKKVRLAVRAHIRHQHTDYDKLLRQGMARGKARTTVNSKITEKATSWGELSDQQMSS